MPSGLFGIEHSNRTVDDHWGKNCFNSSFPTATACYMLANNISAIYIRLDCIDGQLCVSLMKYQFVKCFGVVTSNRQICISVLNQYLNRISNIHLMLLMESTSL